ncbi:hypothetical protein [Polymorphospora lycopeni]|uniref:Uncharacterized protein n=1 Tax=Polymorphospora lycopeni TaxID=3140240 RepID=A0ABV5CKN3_9ACTN
MAAAGQEIAACILYMLIGFLAGLMSYRRLRRLYLELSAEEVPPAVDPVDPPATKAAFPPVADLRPAPTAIPKQWPVINPPRPIPTAARPRTRDEVDADVAALNREIAAAWERRWNHHPKHGATEQWEVPADLRTSVVADQVGRSS